MTAANLIVRERAAYLLTDSATYNREGMVLYLQPKVIVSPELRIAISTIGETWDSKPAVIQSWVALQPSSDAAVAGLPSLVAMMRSDLESYYHRRGWLMRAANEWPPPHVFHLIIAIWSEERERPEGYIISSQGSAFYGYVVDVLNAPGGRVYQMAQHIQPPAELCFDHDHAERDGLALLEAQRRWVNADGHHIVGGAAQLTTVSEAGVSTVVLREWPDEVGRAIDPTIREAA